MSGLFYLLEYQGIAYRTLFSDILALAQETKEDAVSIIKRVKM